MRDITISTLDYHHCFGLHTSSRAIGALERRIIINLRLVAVAVAVAVAVVVACAPTARNPSKLKIEVSLLITLRHAAERTGTCVRGQAPLCACCCTKRTSQRILPSTPIRQTQRRTTTHFSPSAKCSKNRPARQRLFATRQYVLEIISSVPSG